MKRHKPHILHVVFRPKSEWTPELTIECPFDPLSPDRPCAVWEDEAARTVLIHECGITTWLSEGYEAVGQAGELSASFEVDVRWVNGEYPELVPWEADSE